MSSDAEAPARTRDGAERPGHGALSGQPRPLSLLREACAVAVSQPVATGLAALITAAVCAVILATTGQAAASERRVIGSIDDAGARALLLSDPTGRAQIAADGLDRIAALPGVEWVTGVGRAGDVTVAALGDAGHQVPARPIFTDLPPAAALVDGRAPRVGEAVAGREAMGQLGFSDGVGSVAGSDYRGGVVGTFEAHDPIADYSGILLYRTEPDPGRVLREIHVVARSSADVETLERAVPMLLSAEQPSQVVVESPTALVDLQSVIAGELGASSRRLMLLVLTAGLVLIGITLYGATATRRRDFGRRRALGSSRSSIVMLVLAHTALAASAGALLGTGAGMAILDSTEGALPAATFTAGVAVLGVLAAVAAALLPAIAAAMRDPVRILRVP